MKLLLATAFSISCMFIVAPLPAQNEREDSLVLFLLEPVTVTAYRFESTPIETPFSVTIVDNYRLESGQQGLALDEALLSVPGVFVQNAENFAQDIRISVRGFGARSSFGIRGIQIFTDGFPESTPDGQGQVDNIDPASVERLEFVRGTTGALYGNASGGYINMRTLDFTPEVVLRAGVNVGSYGFRKYSAGVSSGISTRVLYNIKAAYTTIDGFREHSAMEQWNLNGGMRFKIDSSLIAILLINYANSPTAQDPGAITREQALADRRSSFANNIELDAGESVEQVRTGLVLTKTISAKTSLQAKAFLTRRDFENSLPFLNGGITVLDRTFYGASVLYQRKSRLADRPWSLILGADFSMQEDDRQRYNNILGVRGNRSFEQRELFSEAALFGVQEWDITNRLLLYLGLRYDHLTLKSQDRFLINGDDSGKKNYDRLNPLGGLTFRLKQNLSVFTSFSTAFETPALNELSNNPFANGGFNPQLKPQEATTGELGLKALLLNKRLDVEAVGFYIALSDEIVPYELSQFPGRTFYRNSGRSTRKGFEFSSKAVVVKKLYLFAHYTWSDFVYEDFAIDTTDFSGRRQPGIPEHIAWADLRYINQVGLWGSLQGRFTGKYFANDANTVSTDAYFLLNARAGYNWKRGKLLYRISLGINNLTGVSWYGNVRTNSAGSRFFEPAPGTNWFANFQLFFH